MKKIFILILMFGWVNLSFAQETELRNIDILMDVFWNKTTCLNISQQRLEAMNEMQIYADQCSHTYFNEYYACEEIKSCDKLEKTGILRFHVKALERIVQELQDIEVPEGKVVMWQLYNMGYVIKTAVSCFGIDIKHKHAERLVPFLDFILITHNHGDHYTIPFIDAMTKANKPVYSNFLNNEYKINRKRKIIIGEIEIETNLVDHNKELLNYVVTYQIDCGKTSGNFIILHTGDAYDANQIIPSKPVDVFIPHLAVGLDMHRAVEQINPKVVLMSHILELGHAVDKWRWSYQYGIDRCIELNRKDVWLPVWGEKISFEK